MGTLIVIEGTDGSGKATQSKLLYEQLKKEGYPVLKIDFPNYNSEASALVKMYLKGDFGLDAESVNPYAASTFYAVDRYASYKKDWEGFYENGGIIIADRYTTSNMIHQSVKFKDAKAKEDYLDWLYHLEFELYQLPTPNHVFFLDVPPTANQKLRENRNNKITGEKEQDIHEKNESYLSKVYDNSLEIAKKYNWDKILCTNDEDILSIEVIHACILEKTKKIIN